MGAFLFVLALVLVLVLKLVRSCLVSRSCSCARARGRARAQEPAQNLNRVPVSDVRSGCHPVDCYSGLCFSKFGVDWGFYEWDVETIYAIYIYIYWKKHRL